MRLAFFAWVSGRGWRGEFCKLMQAAQASANGDLRIVAECEVHDLVYWRNHPMVAHVIGAIGRDDPGTMLVWLTLRSDDSGTPPIQTMGYDGEPQRAPDLELYGAGAPHGCFWRLCPELEHLDLFHDPESLSPGGWWVARLWLAKHVEADRVAPPVAC